MSYFVSIAVNHLQAEPVGGGLDQYTYWAHETQRYYLVTTDDLARLGEALDAGREDAYSHWCAETPAAEVAR